MKKTLPTIIIPAHNEEKSIRKTLDGLKKGLLDHFQIIVICNGCSDDTFQIVSEFEQVICQEILVASKIAAIQYAESLNAGFPRIYLDADVKLTVDDAIKIFKVIQSNNNPGLFFPKSKTNTENCQTLVKWYYQSWYKTSFVQDQGFGSGVYALNQKGRNRFHEWPKLVSDDGFIRTLFRPNEIHLIKNTCVEVNAPKTWWQLIRIKARSKYGNLELKQIRQNSNQTVHNYFSPRNKSWSKSQILLSVNYYIINLIALIWAYWMLKIHRFSWLTDKNK